jgi:site-specific DNA recombinase
MNRLQVALYARVSSEQQAEAHTIASQVAELEARIAADGFDGALLQRFLDEGWSGATLVRPALEQVRDQAAVGAIDLLYVQCPDRLARRYAYQALVLEELVQAGVEVRFLNRPVGETPEDQLLLQMQGMIAEYARYADIGITLVMPRARLCRVGER